jgi:pimeloyl-ACP methyl ester carboxylesterase
MPHATTDDGVRLYYEETGTGSPMVFVHEFAGDHRSWEPQVRYFSRRYRCIAYSARGYAPSDVPDKPEQYSQARAVADIATIVDQVARGPAYVVGLSMGGYATLHFGLNHAAKARALVVAGCGYGAEPGPGRTTFQEESRKTSELFLKDGMAKTAAQYGAAGARLPFKTKDPRGYEEFAARLAEHSARGAAYTMRGVQSARPSLWDFEDKLKALTVPTLIVSGDEDEACLNPGLFLKRDIPSAGLLVVPNTGHVINLEEPDLFNRAVGDFLTAVENGGWRPHAARQAGK